VDPDVARVWFGVRLVDPFDLGFAFTRKLHGIVLRDAGFVVCRRLCF